MGYRHPSLDLLYTRINPGDIAGNVLLYIPLGLVSTRSFRRTFLIALGISVCVELRQFISPTRFPGVADVVSNVLGACIGSSHGSWTAVFKIESSTLSSSPIGRMDRRYWPAASAR